MGIIDVVKNWGSRFMEMATGEKPNRVGVDVTHYRPDTGAEAKTHFHKSKYLPDGTVVAVGSPITEFKTNKAKEILDWNSKVK